MKDRFAECRLILLWTDPFGRPQMLPARDANHARELLAKLTGPGDHYCKPDRIYLAEVKGKATEVFKVADAALTKLASGQPPYS